jgi:hypothetical protein
VRDQTRQVDGFIAERDAVVHAVANLCLCPVGYTLDYFAPRALITNLVRIRSIMKMLDDPS